MHENIRFTWETAINEYRFVINGSLLTENVTWSEEIPPPEGVRSTTGIVELIPQEAREEIYVWIKWRLDNGTYTNATKNLTIQVVKAFDFHFFCPKKVTSVNNKLFFNFSLYSPIFNLTIGIMTEDMTIHPSYHNVTETDVGASSFTSLIANTTGKGRKYYFVTYFFKCDLDNEQHFYHTEWHSNISVTLNNATDTDPNNIWSSGFFYLSLSVSAIIAIIYSYRYYRVKKN